jgi:hypothetical protein
MCGVVSVIAPASASGRARSSDPRCSAERPKRGWIVPIASTPLGAIAGIAFGMDEIHWTMRWTIQTLPRRANRVAGMRLGCD